MDTVALFAGMIGLSPREGAARFAAAGVPIFPCKPAEKRPLTEHGFRDATSDDRQIARWWSRWPEANIGMPTGRASAVEVVDIDVHGRVRGFAAFELARREGLVDRWQALVKTASGGMHAYYPADPDRVQASWQAASAGIDFRGEGGYVIVPPSLVLFEGNRSAYELIGAGRGDAVSIDGSALRQFLDPRPTPAATMPAEARRDVDAERIAAWLAARAEGERNRALYWAACRLAENGDHRSERAQCTRACGGARGAASGRDPDDHPICVPNGGGADATLSHQWWQLSIPLAQRAGDLVIPGATDPRSGRIAVWTAVVGTVFIAVGAFWLSFTALADLATPVRHRGDAGVGVAAHCGRNHRRRNRCRRRARRTAGRVVSVDAAHDRRCGIGRRKLDPCRCRGRCRCSSRACSVGCRSTSAGASRDHTPDGRSHPAIPASRLLHSRDVTRPVHRSRSDSLAGRCSGEGCP